MISDKSGTRLLHPFFTWAVCVCVCVCVSSLTFTTCSAHLLSCTLIRLACARAFAGANHRGNVFQVGAVKVAMSRAVQFHSVCLSDMIRVGGP